MSEAGWGGAPWLLLLDIDGTLVWRAATEHAEAVVAAIQEIHGPGLELGGVDAAGRTDRWIIRSLLRDAGLSDGAVDEQLDAVLALAADEYERRCPDDLCATVIDGIPSLIDELAADDRYVLGLVTGNVESIAHRKLTAAGLAPPLQPWVGAYGSDHELRDRLVPIAQQRAAVASGRAGAWPSERTLVIGDTPHDIACARAAGAFAIGVTTGACGPGDLAAADRVAQDAAELGAAIRDLTLAGAG